jgi:Domain of unknown function (DUF4149)
MTKVQGISIAIVSLWVGWTLFMWFAATRSFRTADRVLKSPPPEFSRIVQSLSPENTRQVLRYLASEINRTYFRAYGWGQIALGSVLLVLVLLKTPRDTFSLVVVAGMLFIVLILTLGVMPQIIALGRNIDFLPRSPAPPDYQRFWKLHMTFTGLDGAKLLAGLVLLFRMIGGR